MIIISNGNLCVFVMSGMCRYESAGKPMQRTSLLEAFHIDSFMEQYQ